MKTEFRIVSMTDFVLELNQNLKLAEDIIPQYKQIIKYARFLKQPLKLEMFVPCDEDGNILKEPDYTINAGSFIYEDECLEYGKAKSKVLFKGFELSSETNDTWIFRLNGDFPYMIFKTQKIEFLHRLKQPVTLTESATKQIS